MIMNNQVKLVIADFDGIYTDGTKTYDDEGWCVSKKMCDRDFSATKRFRALGIPVVVITGDEWNIDVLSKRKIPWYHSRIDNKHVPKESFLPKIQERFGISSADMIYIGDDLFDISIMKVLGRENSFCPINSPNIVLDHCNEKFTASAGGDCISRLFDFLEDEGRIPKIPFEEVFPKMLELDKQEIF